MKESRVRQIIREVLSKPKYGYHVAPSTEADRIQSQGITPRGSRQDISGDPTATRTYFWRDLDTAQWFAQEMHGGNADIWEVNLKGLNIKPDPESQNMAMWSTRFDEDDEGLGWYYEGTVPPKRILGKARL